MNPIPPSRRRPAVLLLLAALSFGSLPGCVLLVGAAVVAGAVYTTGEDAAAVRLDAPRDEVFEAARAYVNAKGLLESANPYSGHIEARVWDSNVTVSVKTDDDGLVKVEVKARQMVGFAPDPEAAKTIASGIAARLPGQTAK